MQRFGAYLFIAIFFVIIVSGIACGATVLVQVFEREENITPLAGALVYANNTLAGKTDSGGILEFFTPASGQIPIRVEKFGYDAWEGDIGTNTSQLLVELQKAKIILSVHVYDGDTMAPLPGVSVSLGRGGAENISLSDSNGTAGFNVRARGTYLIGTDAEHYTPVSLEVEVGTAGKEVQVLMFRDDRFSIIIKDGDSGVPLPGARIFVEGIESGVTDPKGVLTLPMPRGKVYLIRVVTDGYENYNSRQIVESDTAFLTIPLTKVPFTLFISVYNEENDPVEGAFILVDNRTVGTTSRFGRAVLTNLTAGRYLLEVQHPGYAPARQPFTVAVQGEDIVAELRYLKENMTVRTVEGSLDPVPGVKISLNGKEAGFTDEKGTLPVLMRVNLSYTITAEKEGYQPVRIEQVIDPSNTTSSLVIPMKRNFSWMLLGIAGLGVATVIGVVLVLRMRSGSHKHGKHGGL